MRQNPTTAINVEFYNNTCPKCIVDCYVLCTLL